MRFGHVGRWKGVTHCVSVIRSRPLPGQGCVTTPQILSDPKQVRVPKKGVNNGGRPSELQYMYMYIYIYVYMYICIYVYMYICIYVYM